MSHIKVKTKVIRIVRARGSQKSDHKATVEFWKLLITYARKKKWKFALTVTFHSQ